MKTKGHLRLVHSRPRDDIDWILMDDTLDHQIRVVRAPETDVNGMGIAVSCSCRKIGEDLYEPFDELVTPKSNVHQIWMKHLS